MAVGAGVAVAVAVGAGVGVAVAVGAGVGVAVAVAVGVGIAVAVAVGVGIAVAVAVGVGIVVAVAVGVGITVAVRAALTVARTADTTVASISGVPDAGAMSTPSGVAVWLRVAGVVMGAGESTGEIVGTAGVSFWVHAEMRREIAAMNRNDFLRI